MRRTDLMRAATAGRAGRVRRIRSMRMGGAGEGATRGISVSYPLDTHGRSGEGSGSFAALRMAMRVV